MIRMMQLIRICCTNVDASNFTLKNIACSDYGSNFTKIFATRHRVWARLCAFTARLRLHDCFGKSRRRVNSKPTLCWAAAVQS